MTPLAPRRWPLITLAVGLCCLALPGAVKAQVLDQCLAPSSGALPTLPERSDSNVPREPTPARPPPESMRAALESGGELPGLPGLDTLLFDEPGDGAIWVLGRGYKAKVDSEGLTYIPFFGSRAPHNYPLVFKLQSASIGGLDLPLASNSPPIRDEQRIYVLHGAVTEVLDFALDSVEQSFVVERGNLLGELEVQLDVETELSRTFDSSGQEFSTTHGVVRYGLATTLDAGGRELSTSTFPMGRGMEFKVSAEDVAQASGDLTIDPIIATLNVDSSSLDDSEPDVAYDVTNDRYIVVYERVYSQNDHDALCQMLQGSTGMVIPNSWSYIDFTWADWRQLSVANLSSADQFLVVGSVGPAPEVIKCRTRSAGSLTMGNQLTISAGADGNCQPGSTSYPWHHCVWPVVGGDPWPGGSAFYCVAWVNHDIFPNNSWCDSIFVTVVSPSGWSSAPMLYDNPTHLSATTSADNGAWPSLAISKSNGDAYSGASQDWNLVWRSAGEGIIAARVHWNGLSGGQRRVIVPWGVNPVASRISVSTSESNSTRRFLVTWDTSPLGSIVRMYGALIDPSSVGWGVQPPSWPMIDLTQLQGNPNSQWNPSVDCDGANYVVAFNANPGGNKVLAAAEFGFFFNKWLGLWSFGCVEPQTQVWSSNFPMGRARICAEASGAGSRRNALIGGTNWTVNGFLGDPVVGLHAH